MKRGVVYACSHPRWLEETLASAQSFRRHMPDLARELYVTASLFQAAADALRAHFTDVVVLDTAEHPTRPRFEACRRTELDQAIFLDGDTLLLAPVPELFDLLDHFDVALTAALQYLNPRAVHMGVFEMLPAVPAAQPEWNSGLIVARVDAPFRALTEQWSALYARSRAMGFQMDQAALRSALVHSRLRIATIPNNYNFRAHVAQAVTGDVKILHAHGDLRKIAGYVNKGDPMRLYLPTPGDIHGFQPKV